MIFLHERIGALHFDEHARAVFVIRTPHIGDFELARGALEQRDAERGLQTRQFLADGRLRYSDYACCVRIAHRFDDFREDRHRRHLFQLIHRLSQCGYFLCFFAAEFIAARPTEAMLSN